MSDLKFSLDAEDTSLLAQYAIGASLSSEVRVVRNIYRNSENGYSIYDAEDTDYRLLKLSGYFPTPLRLDGYYKVRGIVKKGKYGRTLQVDDYKSALPEDRTQLSQSCVLSRAWTPGHRMFTGHWGLRHWG